jgi:hypothetical protein
LIENIHGLEAHSLPYLLDYRPYEGTVEIETENIVAFLEGSDPELKEEVVVLTAHYDHIGITQPDETGDYINNGADDDGSGTVALMAIAHALKNASDDGYRPRRSVLFLHVSAEEKGLLGSRYYSDHPIFPIENTVASTMTIWSAEVPTNARPRAIPTMSLSLAETLSLRRSTASFMLPTGRVWVWNSTIRTTTWKTETSFIAEVTTGISDGSKFPLFFSLQGFMKIITVQAIRSIKSIFQN